MVRGKPSTGEFSNKLLVWEPSACFGAVVPIDVMENVGGPLIFMFIITLEVFSGNEMFDGVAFLVGEE
jgi:hypothetical protein